LKRLSPSPLTVSPRPCRCFCRKGLPSLSLGTFPAFSALSLAESSHRACACEDLALIAHALRTSTPRIVEPIMRATGGLSTHALSRISSSRRRAEETKLISNRIKPGVAPRLRPALLFVAHGESQASVLVCRSSVRGRDTAFHGGSGNYNVMLPSINSRKHRRGELLSA
jgi:hypothetical protein